MFRKEEKMHQSHTYASQGSKSAFVEIAQRRAEIGRLQREVAGTRGRPLQERYLPKVRGRRGRRLLLVRGHLQREL